MLTEDSQCTRMAWISVMSMFVITDRQTFVLAIYDVIQSITRLITVASAWDLKKPFLSSSEKIQSIRTVSFICVLLCKMNYVARIDVHMIFLKSKLNYYCMAALPQKKGSYYLKPSFSQLKIIL